MSKTDRKHRGKKPASSRPRVSVIGIFGGLIIIGAAVVGFSLLMERSTWPYVAVGWIALIVWLVNAAALGAYRGRKMPPWRIALASVPLRTVGFGTRHGKPVEAAHDAPGARRAIGVSVVVSLLLVAACAVLLIPALQPWA